MRAEATAEALRRVGEAIGGGGGGSDGTGGGGGGSGREAANLRIAEKWVEAFAKVCSRPYFIYDNNDNGVRERESGR